MYMFSKIMKEKYEKEKLLYISNTDALTGLSLIHISSKKDAMKKKLENMHLGERINYGYRMAVSYTHLDVYKRQAICQSVDLPCAAAI